ncbi:MAG: SIS domain-containing protein [Bacteroidia bacterium]|nr:SIS domain-containing protein [Bacteroidia bacterium]
MHTLIDRAEQYLTQETAPFWEAYQQAFTSALAGVRVSAAAGAELPYAEALATVQDWLCTLEAERGQLFIIGNGGSAGVAGHLAVDFLKNGNLRAMAFHDAPLLTCISNDCGYEEVFALPLSRFAGPGDLAICISSSGTSENILRGARTALDAGARVITCTGFRPDNPLRSLGHLNYYVPSWSYGIVETLHQFIIHSFLDAKLHCADSRNVFFRNQPFDPSQPSAL